MSAFFETFEASKAAQLAEVGRLDTQMKSLAAQPAANDVSGGSTARPRLSDDCYAGADDAGL